MEDIDIAFGVNAAGGFKSGTGIENTKVGRGREIVVRFNLLSALGSRRAGMTPVLMDPLLQYKELDCVTIADLGELLQVVKH